MHILRSDVQFHSLFKITLDTYPVIRNKSITDINTNILCKSVAVYAVKASRGIRGITPLILKHTHPLKSNPETRTLNISNTHSKTLCKFVTVYAMKACSGCGGEAPLLLSHTFLFDTSR
jgi:hypothetical protein